MGLLTGLEFRQKLQIMLGNRGFPNEQLDYWIGLGLQKLTSDYEFNVLMNISDAQVQRGTNGIQVASVPDNAAGIVSIRNITDDKVVTKIDWQKYMALDSDAEGEVKHWLRFGQNEIVWPRPRKDTDLSIIYQLFHLPLATGERTILNAAYDRPILLLSTYIALTDLEEPNRATYYLQTAQESVRSIIEREAIEARSTPEPVQAIDSFQELRHGKIH